MTLDKQMITNVAIGVGAATALYALYSFMDSTLTKRHEKLDEAEDEKNARRPGQRTARARRPLCLWRLRSALSDRIVPLDAGRRGSD